MTKYIKRGYCECGRRTSHQVHGEWMCKECEVGVDKTLTRLDTQLLKEIKKSGLSLTEVKTITKTTRIGLSRVKTHEHFHSTGSIKIGVFSDSHIGEAKFDEALFARMGDTFRKEKVDAVYQVGDILEGMSGRDGHVYDLSHVGFAQQINYAVDLFKKYMHGLDVYGIDGNHDGWYKIKNNAGIIVGEELASRISNYTHLGEMEADVKLAPNITMKLFHPNDGSSYAYSYKAQKLIESFSGGEKPNIVLEGHYHKALYMFNRNVHAIECGTLCGQTRFMRGKKIPAHKGFWVLNIKYNKKGIQEFTPKFYPEYHD